MSETGKDYYIIRTKDDGSREYVRKYDGTPYCFWEPATPHVLADALRRGGWTVEVVEIDPAIEAPIF